MKEAIMFFCKFVEKNLDSYAAGKVGTVKTIIIREHLDSCSSCRTKYESITGVKFSSPTNFGDLKKQVKAREHEIIEKPQ
jgi:predicted anti-sigma-YlaC factor YlaD